MIIKIEKLNNEKKRSKILMDDGEEILAFNKTIKEYNLKENDKRSTEDIKRIAKEGEEHLAFTSAVDILTRGLKSEKEIKEKLKKKNFSFESINNAIEKLKGYNYIGDEKFADVFVNYKGQKYGRRKLIYKLTAVKGISRDIAEKVVYNKINDKAEIEKAKGFAKKFIETHRKKRNNLRERVYSHLATKGFEPEIINVVISDINFNEIEEES